MIEFTGKQQAFIREYLVDLNATQAAIRAGYSENVAAEVGSENLRKPHIAAAIEKAMQEREKRTEITQDRVLEELAKIGFANLGDFVKFRTEKTIVGYEEDGSPILDYANIVEMKSSDEIDSAVLSEVSLKDGTVRVKLHDKVQALDKIGRHLGMFKDKLEVSGNAGGPLQVVFNPAMRKPKEDEKKELEDN